MVYNQHQEDRALCGCHWRGQDLPARAVTAGRELSSGHRGHQFISLSHELFALGALDAAER